MDEILINEDIVEISASDMLQLYSAVEHFPMASQVKKQDQFVEIYFPNGDASLEKVNRHCFEKGITLNHMRLRKKSLEAKFFELTKNN